MTRAGQARERKSNELRSRGRGLSWSKWESAAARESLPVDEGEVVLDRYALGWAAYGVWPEPARSRMETGNRHRDGDAAGVTSTTRFDIWCSAPCTASCLGILVRSNLAEREAGSGSHPDPNPGRVGGGGEHMLDGRRDGAFVICTCTLRPSENHQVSSLTDLEPLLRHYGLGLEDVRGVREELCRTLCDTASLSDGRNMGGFRCTSSYRIRTAFWNQVGFASLAGGCT